MSMNPWPFPKMVQNASVVFRWTIGDGDFAQRFCGDPAVIVSGVKVRKVKKNKYDRIGVRTLKTYITPFRVDIFNMGDSNVLVFQTTDSKTLLETDSRRYAVDWLAMIFFNPCSRLRDLSASQIQVEKRSKKADEESNGAFVLQLVPRE